MLLVLWGKKEPIKTKINETASIRDIWFVVFWCSLISWPLVQYFLPLQQHSPDKQTNKQILYLLRVKYIITSSLVIFIMAPAKTEHKNKNISHTRIILILPIITLLTKLLKFIIKIKVLLILKCSSEIIL